MRGIEVACRGTNLAFPRTNHLRVRDLCDSTCGSIAKDMEIAIPFVHWGCRVGAGNMELLQ
ncbi:Hypothetical predicted protein, partial [Paramuricea clavata]